MANFSPALQHVKQHLHQLLPEDQIFQLCRDLGYRWRKRLLDPALTVELFLLQLLAGVAMAALRHVAGIAVSAQAICAAKMRLPLKLLMELVRQSVPTKTTTTWKGFVVHMADGTGFMTQDSEELAGQYGKARNHKGIGHGYPNPKLLALMDLEGGFIQKIITLPWHRQEFTCLTRLFNAIGAGGLLLGDRGLVSFSHLAMLMAQQIAGCFRLPKGQVVFGRGRASHRRIKSLGRQDMLVRWVASQRPKWLSKQRWAALAAVQLTVDASRISFLDALRWLLWNEPGKALPPLVVNPARERPSPPRKIKSSGYHFPLLDRSRDELSKPPSHAT